MNRTFNIKERSDLFIAWAAKQKIYNILFIALILNIGVSIIFSYVLFPGTGTPKHFETKIEEFILTVIAAPAIETYFVQVLIIGAIMTRFNNQLLAIFISALVFGAFHYYSIGYVIKAFISGTIYATVYVTIRQKKLNGFLYLWLLHGLHNLVAFIVNNYIDP